MADTTNVSPSPEVQNKDQAPADETPVVGEKRGRDDDRGSSSSKRQQTLDGKASVVVPKTTMSPFVYEGGTLSFRGPDGEKVPITLALVEYNVGTPVLRLSIPGKDGKPEACVLETPVAVEVIAADATTMDGTYPPDAFCKSDFWMMVRLSPLSDEVMNNLEFPMGGNLVRFPEGSTDKNAKAAKGLNKKFGVKLMSVLRKALNQYIATSGIPSCIAARVAAAETKGLKHIRRAAFGTEKEFLAVQEEVKADALNEAISWPLKPFDVNDLDNKEGLDLQSDDVGFVFYVKKALFQLPEKFFGEIKTATEARKKEMGPELDRTTAADVREYLTSHKEFGKWPLERLMDVFPISGCETLPDWLEALAANRYFAVLVNGCKYVGPYFLNMSGNGRMNFHGDKSSPPNPNHKFLHICHIAYYNLPITSPPLRTHLFGRGDQIFMKFVVGVSTPHEDTPKALFRFWARPTVIQMVRHAKAIYGENTMAITGKDLSNSNGMTEDEMWNYVAGAGPSS
jgi:hypothetical protein